MTRGQCHISRQRETFTYVGDLSVETDLKCGKVILMYFLVMLGTHNVIPLISDAIFFSELHSYLSAEILQRTEILVFVCRSI